MLFPCSKLTPLQSRFLASCSALALVGLIFWTLSHPQLVYAAEMELDGSGQPRGGQDHNWHRIQAPTWDDDALETKDDQMVDGRLDLLRRADVFTIDSNDSPNGMDITPGNTAVWRYPSALGQESPRPTSTLPSNLDSLKHDVETSHADLPPRDQLYERQSFPIFISINTCVQPLWTATNVQTTAPPQLTLYVATSASVETPGPGADQNGQIVAPLDHGFANVSVEGSGDLYMSVFAPKLPLNFAGQWSYELAVSKTGFYHSVNSTGPFLYVADTDNEAALLVTGNLTQANPGDTAFQGWLGASPPPFIVFVALQNNTATMGIEHSYCGWKNASQISGSQRDPQGNGTHVNMTMTTRGVGGKPKEQFLLHGLNRSTSYNVALAMPGNSTNSGKGVVGGGGKVFLPTNMTTKSDGNCKLVYDLKFCDQVAYSVPYNPQTTNFSALQYFFDNYTTLWYQNFNYTLQQIPCDAPSDARYSLAKNCDSCAQAYKQWLCAVSIPRCTDFSLQPHPLSGTNLQPRNVGQSFINSSSLPTDYLTSSYDVMVKAPTLEGSSRFGQTYQYSLATNQSRNPMIDAQIQPGPYNEHLPCEELCYAIVQSCPAALGFNCPYPGRGLEQGYGTMTSVNGMCNFPGMLLRPNGAGAMGAPALMALVVAAVAGLVLQIV